MKKIVVMTILACLATGATLHGQECVTFDFESMATGASVTGADAVSPLLTITGTGMQVVEDQAAIGIVVFNSNSGDNFLPGINTKSFGTGDSSKDLRIDFDPDIVVSSFEIQLFDYGDYFPPFTGSGVATLKAYDSGDTELDSDSVARTQNAIYDAAYAGNSGDTLQVSDADIAYVTLEFTSVVDPGISFDNIEICYTNRCPDPDLVKEITGDNTDLAVEIGQLDTTEYCFTISYSNPDGPAVLILDTVPAEWIVTSVAGDSEDVVGGDPVDDGNGGTVDVFKAGGPKSATKIEWRPDPEAGCGSIEVCVKTRQSPGRRNLKYAPTSCGLLCLNDGAEAYELVDGEPLPDPFWVTEPLCLVAVEDLNGSGIVADGTGDEDGDGLTDLDEVMIYLTEPCNPDTDDDGLNDGEEVGLGTDPLDDDTDDDGEPDGTDTEPLNPDVQ